MKAVHLLVALQSALAVLLTATVVQPHAEGQRVHATAGLEAKFEYCTTCHGPSAQGFRGYYPMPRLAGQQPQYIENQLLAFLEQRRHNPVMANVAHGITPDMFSALAKRMNALNPPPFGGAPTGDVALGKEIYTNGLPDQNVPACSACHGPDAKGQREIPRTRGPTLLVHDPYPFDVEQRTRPGRTSRHILDHAADRGESDAETGGGARRICQRDKVKSCALLRQTDRFRGARDLGS